MKKIIVILVFYVSCFPCSCQEMVDRVDLVYIDESDVIESATGWCYNNVHGKWVDNINCIRFPYGNYQIFNGIRVKKCLFYGEYYYVVIVKDWASLYNKKEDKYEKYPKYCCFLLSVEEYDALFNLTEYPVEIQAICKYDVIDSDWMRVIGMTTEVEFFSSYLYGMDGERIVGGISLITAYKSSEGKIRFIFGRSIRYINDIKDCYFEISELEWNKLKI